jgi:hypothetical protein
MLAMGGAGPVWNATAPNLIGQVSCRDTLKDTSKKVGLKNLLGC